MSNTSYDQTTNMSSNLMNINNTNDKFDVQSVVSGVTNKSKSTNYRRYNLKDYQNLQNSLQNTKLGGLGANIGGEKWEVAKKKKIIEQQYAENLKIMN